MFILALTNFSLQRGYLEIVDGVWLVFLYNTYRSHFNSGFCTVGKIKVHLVSRSMC